MPPDGPPVRIHAVDCAKVTGCQHNTERPVPTLTTPTRSQRLRSIGDELRFGLSQDLQNGASIVTGQMCERFTGVVAAEHLPEAAIDIFLCWRRQRIERFR